MYKVDSPVPTHFHLDGDIKAAVIRAARRMKTSQTQVMNSVLAAGLKAGGFMPRRKVRRASNKSNKA